MGWDIVAIGTHHTLPIQNPLETAKRLAPILNGIVSIGYSRRYRYNKDTHTISISNHEWIEIAELKILPDNWHYSFEICGEDARIIHTEVPSLLDVTYVGEYTKEWLLDDLFGTPYQIYRIGIEDSHISFFMDILKENVEFDVSFNGRWFTFEDIFQEPYVGENKQRLDDFRLYIYDQLKACGCDKAYYFPDQGHGECLYDVINLPSDEWVAFMLSCEYIKDADDNQIILKMSDYIEGNIVLRSDQNVVCIIDDFSDLRG